MGSSRRRRERKMNESISLFNKYLLSRHNNNNNVGSANNMNQSKSFINRSASLLETKFLPQLMRSEGELMSSSSSSSSCSRDQLTIFYDGAIHVYDHVPLDKAQAIMLLAGESSSSSNAATSKMDTQPPTLQSSIPMARRQSLQSFLEKRRCCNRNLVKKKKSSPEASGIDHKSSSKEEEEEEGACICKNNEAASLTPFPSRLGFNVPL